MELLVLARDCCPYVVRILKIRTNDHRTIDVRNELFNLAGDIPAASEENV